MASKEIDKLRFKIDNEFPDTLGNCLVKDSPHYQYACGNKKPYMEWQKSRKKDVAFKCRKFDVLIDSIKRKGVVKPPRIRGDIIYDGHHRVATWASLGHEEIKCREQ